MHGYVNEANMKTKGPNYGDSWARTSDSRFEDEPDLFHLPQFGLVYTAGADEHAWSTHKPPCAAAAAAWNRKRETRKRSNTKPGAVEGKSEGALAQSILLATLLSLDGG